MATTLPEATEPFLDALVIWLRARQDARTEVLGNAIVVRQLPAACEDFCAYLNSGADPALARRISASAKVLLAELEARPFSTAALLPDERRPQ